MKDMDVARHLISLTLFVLGAVGLYQISRDRGFKRPWLACIPFANSWVIGWIYDNIQRIQGRETSFCKRLLGLDIAVQLSLLLMRLFPLFAGIWPAGKTVFEALTVVFLAAGLAAGVVWIFHRIKGTYCIYKDYMPDKAVLLAVLSCFWSLYNVFFFAIRKKPSISIDWAFRHRRAARRNGYEIGELER